MFNPIQLIKDIRFAFRRNIFHGELWQVYQVLGVSDDVYSYKGRSLKKIGKVGFMEVDDNNIKNYYKNILMSYKVFGNLLVIKTSHGYHFVTFTVMDEDLWRTWDRIWDVPTNYVHEWRKPNILRISPKQEPIKRWNMYINKWRMQWGNPLSLGHLSVYKLAKAITKEEMELLTNYAIPTKVRPLLYMTKGEV